jgi:nucleoside phosphorylase
VLEEDSIDVFYSEVLPAIDAYVVDDNVIGWDMIATEDYPLSGMRRFHALVKVPRQAQGVQALMKLSAAVSTDIGPRRMGLSKEQLSRSCVICIPHARSVALQSPIVSDYCQVVILTSLRSAYNVIRSYLTDVHDVDHPDGTIYERGRFVVGQRFWDVGIVEIGTGNVEAAAATERAIRYFKPDKAFFIGTAGGLKDVKMGDVVASTKVYSYEAGNAEEKFRIRPMLFRSTYRMTERARAEARKTDWLRRLPASPVPHAQSPQVYLGSIAAGEKVISSTRSAIAKLLLDKYADTLAVDMEGYGFMEAIYMNPRVEAMVIRGISNCIDDKSEVDTISAQEKAVQCASAFAFEVLAKLSDVEDK